MKLNVRSIRQRLQRLEQYISALEKQQPATLETFRNDFTRQLAVERAFQAAIGGWTDIAAHITSVYQLGHPEGISVAVLTFDVASSSFAVQVCLKPKPNRPPVLEEEAA